jgi:isocitrate dehydrogenase kinase/phosphatase
MEPPKNERALALAIAQVVLWGFNKHYRLFREISASAKQRFERGDWQAIQLAQRERIAFYDRRVGETVERLEREFNADSLSDSVWPQVKYHYINLLIDHNQPECAETFFNSVCCRILHRDYFHNEFIFVRPTISTEHLDSDPPSYRSYYPADVGVRAILRQLLADFEFEVEFQDIERDIGLMIESAKARFGARMKLEANHQIQVLHSLFFRNKGAYAIGTVLNGTLDVPFAIALLRTSSGKIAVDALLFEHSDLLALFSFSRAYFMVDIEVPAAYVQFLRGMLPSRPKFELYNMIGLQKHGKALFYRDFLHHLAHSSDQFIVAPGIRGLVMLVFTLPSFPFVFKVIKDVIAPPKEVDREGVKRKYLMVKRHDRVGRMADTLEYSDVAFPKARFSEELLRELRAYAPSLLLEEEDRYVIRHLYIERRMTPLNLYLQAASPTDKEAALKEYGLAIKQLAAANIFPGDMLYKNFGVTRNRRVVFYDYDEIEYMTDCNFRHVPEARSYEDEMASEPWYHVGRNDVFPEEWRTFLLGDDEIRATLSRFHPEIFDADYWNALKDRIQAGHIEDVFPYDLHARYDPSRLEL